MTLKIESSTSATPWAESWASLQNCVCLLTWLALMAGLILESATFWEASQVFLQICACLLTWLVTRTNWHLTWRDFERLYGFISRKECTLNDNWKTERLSIKQPWAPAWSAPEQWTLDYSVVFSRYHSLAHNQLLMCSKLVLSTFLHEYFVLWMHSVFIKCNKTLASAINSHCPIVLWFPNKTYTFGVIAIAIRYPNVSHYCN